METFFIIKVILATIIGLLIKRYGKVVLFGAKKEEAVTGPKAPFQWGLPPQPLERDYDVYAAAKRKALADKYQ